MKKLLIVACAFMMCCVMLLPVSAFNDTYEYNGESLPDIRNLDLDFRFYQYLHIGKDGDTYILYVASKPSYYDSSKWWRDCDEEYPLMKYYLTNNEWVYDSTYTSKLGGSTSQYFWANYDIYDKYKTYVWREGEDNYLIFPCDGTTCPATDVNTDNICDDCGAVFAVLRDYTPADFPSGYPVVPSLDMPDANYYLYKVKSSGSTYLLVYPSNVTPTYDTSQQNGLLYYSESYGNYRLDTTNNKWVLSSDDSPYIIGGTNNNSVEIFYSSHTIYDQNGDTFFPIPLWMEMDNLTQREMTTLPNNLGGVMTILTVCGVGCLALLIVLSLFGKRSLISRE